MRSRCCMGRCDAAGVILFCVYALILFCNRSITCTIKPGNADHRFFSKVVDRLAQTVNHLFQQCKDPAAKAFCPRCFPNLFTPQTLVPLQGFASDRASCRFPDGSTRTTHPSCTAQRCRTVFRSTAKPRVILQKGERRWAAYGTSSQRRVLSGRQNRPGVG